MALTYQIELTNAVVDVNPSVRWDDSVTTRLYATYNGMFAGYVRADAGNSFTVGGTTTNGESNITPADQLKEVKVGVKYGNTVYSGSQVLFDKEGDKQLSDLATITSGSSITFSAVGKEASITSGPSTKVRKYSPEGSDSVARTGSYSILEISTASALHFYCLFDNAAIHFYVAAL